MSDFNKFVVEFNKLKSKYKQNNNVRKIVPTNVTVKKSMFNKFSSKLRNTLNKSNANTKNNVKKFTNAQKNRDNYLSELINLQYTYQYIDVFDNLPEINCDTILPFKNYDKKLLCKFLKVNKLIDEYYTLIANVDGNVDKRVKGIVDKELRLDKLNVTFVNFPSNRIPKNKNSLFFRSINIPSLDEKSRKNYNKTYTTRMTINETRIKQIKKIYIILKFIEAYIKYYDLVEEDGYEASIKSYDIGDIIIRNNGPLTTVTALQFIEKYNKYGSVLYYGKYRDIFHYNKIDSIVNDYIKINNIIGTSSSTSSSSSSSTSNQDYAGAALKVVAGILQAFA
jgi:hypothetical protein